jgi:hypothetical protein
MKHTVLSSLFALFVLCGASAEMLAAEQTRCARQTSAESLAAYHARARMMVTLGWQPLVAPIFPTPADERVVTTTPPALPGS